MSSQAMSTFAKDVFTSKYSKEGKESWEETSRRVADNVVGPVFPELVEPIYELIRDRIFMPGGRYLYAAGRKRQAVNNCFLLRAEDTREGWGNLADKAINALMYGGGIGVDYSDIRPDGSTVGGLGGQATGPLALMQMVNEIGRGVMQGGSRRSAIWGGINWKHPDALKLTEIKNWPDYLVKAKEQDWNAAAPLDMTNISVLLDDDFFEAYNEGDGYAEEIYNRVVENMLRTGEPGFSIDTEKNSGETLRNACTEVTSDTDSDVCNLGSIVLPRVQDSDHMEKVVYYSTAFLMAGTIVGELPYDRIYDVRERNRRLGLGLMGFAEWFASRGLEYGTKDQQLQSLLETYRDVSDRAAGELSDKLGVSTPVKTRAIAPTGTISIIAETTSGIEPFFCAAYKRRWLDKGVTWREETVVDVAVQRLLDRGVPPEWVEDAYDLANDPGRRLDFQAWVQGYVDHAISSTLNLPAYEDQSFSSEEFGKVLFDNLPYLRGVTVYPDGSRGGQPLSKISLDEALGRDTMLEETSNTRSCVNGVCGL